jgi:hypothetical protein
MNFSTVSRSYLNNHERLGSPVVGFRLTTRYKPPPSA